MKKIYYKIDNKMPVVAQTDVLIIGGSLRLFKLAKKYIDSGKRCCVITDQTYLGDEITKYLRPWIYNDKEQKKIVREFFEIDSNEYKNKEYIPVQLDKLKTRLEDYLLDLGVQIIYATMPIAINKEQNQYKIAIGNKAGTQIIISKRIIDLTEQGITSFLLKKQNKRVDYKKKIIYRVIDFMNVVYDKDYIQLPSSLGAYDNRIRVYRGITENQVYVEIPIEVNMPTIITPVINNKIQSKTRMISLDVAKWLIKNELQFSNSVLGMGSIQATDCADYAPVYLLSMGDKIYNEIQQSDIEYYCYANNQVKIESNNYTNYEIEPYKFTQDTALNEWMPNDKIEDGFIVEEIATYDVTVAGGGTSGALAAYTSARENVKTCVIDLNPSLGGTSTFGGVTSYWFGNISGYNKIVDSRVDKLCDELKYPINLRVWSPRDSWNIEAKIHVLTQLCLENDVDIYSNSIVSGIFKDKDKVHALLIATPFGPYVIKSKVVIDSTGDGDIAAFAGAKYTYGSSELMTTMWASLANYMQPGIPINNFTTMVHVGHPIDYTRKIIEGRKYKETQLYDHGTYLAPRESRHIHCHYMISINDQLLQKEYDDTISVCFSNCDIKGLSDEDILLKGVLPPNLDIEIPFRSLIPIGVDGLIIAGKAIGASSSALAAIRMQRDMQTIGGVAGLAAAICVKDDISLGLLDVKKLQRKLVDADVLIENIISRQVQNNKVDIKELLYSIKPDDKLYIEQSLTQRTNIVPPIMKICALPTHMVRSELIRLYNKSAGEMKALIAKIMLIKGITHGSRYISLYIISTIEKCNKMPHMNNPRQFSRRFLPDHCSMSDIAYLMYIMAEAPFDYAYKVVKVATKYLSKTTRNYIDGKYSTFHYIHAIAYIVRHQPNKLYISTLKKILNFPEFSIEALDDIEDQVLQERLYLLKLALAISWAKCGSMDAIKVLNELRNNKRHIIAVSAHKELKAYETINR